MKDYKRMTKRDEFGNADIIGLDSHELASSLDFDGLNKLTFALNKFAALDEKIVKLYDFLSCNDGETARRIAGFAQVDQMSDQMRVMMEYSNILNKRILTWRHN